MIDDLLVRKVEAGGREASGSPKPRPARPPFRPSPPIATVGALQQSGKKVVVEEKRATEKKTEKKEASGPPHPAPPGYKWLKRSWGWVLVQVSRPKPQSKSERKPPEEREASGSPKPRARRVHRVSRRRPRSHVVRRVLRKQEEIEKKEKETAELVKAEEEAEKKAARALAEAIKQVKEQSAAGVAQQLAEAAKQAAESLSKELAEKAAKIEKKVALASVQAERESIPAEAKVLKALGLARKAAEEAAEAQKKAESELKPEAEKLAKKVQQLNKQVQELSQTYLKLQQKVEAAKLGKLSQEEYEKLKQEVEQYNVERQKLEEARKQLEKQLQQYSKKAEAVRKQAEKAKALHGSAKHMLESAVKELGEARSRYAKTLGELTVEAMGLSVEAKRLSKALEKAVEEEAEKLKKTVKSTEAKPKGMPTWLAETLKLAPAADTLYEIAGMTGAEPGVVVLEPGRMEYVELGKPGYVVAAYGEATATPVTGAGIKLVPEYAKYAAKREAHTIPESFTRLAAEVVLNPERVLTTLRAAALGQSIGTPGYVLPILERCKQVYEKKKAELLSKGVPPETAEKLASAFARAELGETTATGISFGTALLNSILKAAALHEALKPPELREYAIVPREFKAELVKPGAGEYELVKAPGEDVWTAVERPPEAMARIKVTGQAELMRTEPLKPGKVIGGWRFITPSRSVGQVVVSGPEGEEIKVPVVGSGRPGVHAVVVEGGPGRAGIAVQEVPGGRVSAATVQRLESLTGARVPWSAEIVVHGRGAPATEMVEEFMAKAEKVLRHAALQRLPLGGKAVQQLLSEPLVKEAVGPLGGTMKVVVFPEPGKLAEAVPGAELLGAAPVSVLTPKLKPGMVVGPEAGLIQVEPGEYVQSLTELLQVRKMIEERVDDLLKKLEELSRPVELPEIFKELPGRLKLKELELPKLELPPRLHVPSVVAPRTEVPEVKERKTRSTPAQPELVPEVKPVQPEIAPKPTPVVKTTPTPVDVPSVVAPRTEVHEVKEEEEEVEVPEIPPIEAPPVPTQTEQLPPPIEVPAPPEVTTAPVPPAPAPPPPEEELKAPRATPPMPPWWQYWWLAYLRYLRRFRRMMQAEALTL